MIRNRLWTPSRVLRKYSTRPPSPPLPPNLPEPSTSTSTSFQLPAPAPPHQFPLQLTRPALPIKTVVTTLYQLKPISSLGTTAQLRIVPRGQLKNELREWRRACSIAHAALAGPLHSKMKHHWRKVVRIVAHTMRLLMTLNHFQAAKELDRAFFSFEREEISEGLERLEEGEGRKDGEEDAEKWREVYLGDGIGLRRGPVHLAWMQSLALRLEPSAFDSLDAFAPLLKEMHDEASGRLVHRVTIAFLIRRVAHLAGAVEEDRREGRISDAIDIEELEQMLSMIRASQFGGERIVKEADLGSTIKGLRTANRGGLSSREFSRADDLAKELSKEADEAMLATDVDATDRDELLMDIQATLEHSSDEFITPTTSRRHPKPDHNKTPTSSIIDRAQTLHLAASFLLLRSRLGNTIFDLRERQHIISHSIKSTVELYSGLLDLLPCADSPVDPATLTVLISQLRQRQSSTLYRLLWACIGTFDVAHSREALFDSHRKEALQVPRLDSTALRHIDAIIRTTLDRLSTLPATYAPDPDAASARMSHIAVEARVDPRLLLISPRFWRRLLYSLTLPAGSHNNLHYTPWSTLKRYLELMARCAEYDYKIGLPAYLLKRAVAERIFQRNSMIIHMVRAVVLSGFDDRSEIELNEESKEEVETIETRLRFFFDLLDRLEVAGSAAGMNRHDFAHATGIILKNETERGGMSSEYRARLNEIATEWSGRDRRKVSHASVSAASSMDADSEFDHRSSNLNY